MRALIDDCACVLIRASLIKSLLMNENDYSRLASINNLESLGTFSKRFFPNFAPIETSVAEFEWQLKDTYFDIFEKIIVGAPAGIQNLIRGFLIKYEILNIKICIYGVIEGTDYDDRYIKVFDSPSKMLDRWEMLQHLLRAKSIDDIRSSVKKSPYYKIIKKGLEIYQKDGNTFTLEHELDKYYYLTLIQAVASSSSSEGTHASIFKSYIMQEIDYYNLNLIYRAIYNKIGIGVINSFLIDKGYLFQKEELDQLLGASSLDNLVRILTDILRPHKEFSEIPEIIKNPDPNSWNTLSHLFLRRFLTKFQHTILSDLNLYTLSLILRIILQKEMEIEAIVARGIQITLAGEKLMR
ncbi:MAG: V-type ATPase subunit [Promethearchaeota archaeon]